MTAPAGFDPEAVLHRPDGTDELVEVTLWQLEDGTWRLSVEHDDETVDDYNLSAKTMADIIAQAAA